MTYLHNTFKFILTCLLSTGLLLATHWVHAQDSAGRVVMARGEVQALDADGNSRSLKRRDSVFSNEIIKTGANGKVQIRFVDNALLALKANSELNIKSYIYSEVEKDNNQVLLELVAGGFRTLTGQIGKGNKEAYKVDTPVASIGIRGTLYDLQVTADKVFAGVWKGGISLDTQQGQFDLGFGANFDFAEIGSGGDFTGLLTPPEVFVPPAQGDKKDQAAKDSESNSDSNKSPEQGEMQEGEQSGEQKQQGQNSPPSPNVAGNQAPSPFEKDQAPRTEEEVGNKFAEQDQRPTDGNIAPDDNITQPADGYSPDARLTPAEYVQLANSPDVALLIGEDGFNVAVVLNEFGNTNNEAFFLSTLEQADGTVGIETIHRGDAPQVAFTQQPWLDNVSWGIWQGSSATPIQRYQTFDDNESFAKLEKELFYMQANPASQAEMQNGFSEGSFSFGTSASSLSAGKADFIANSNTGIVTDLNLQFEVNFSGNSLNLSNGHLNAFVDTSAVSDMNPDNVWILSMSPGSIDGSTLNSDLTGGVYQLIDGTPNEVEDASANGTLNGIFLSPTSGGQINNFAGGFNLNSGDNTVGGIILLKRGEDTFVYTPPPPIIIPQ